MTQTDVIVTRPLPAAAPAQRRSGWIYAMGRLQPGRSLADAASELTALSTQFAREFPQQNQGSQYEAQLLGDALVGDARQPLLLLLGAVAFVLLIACANVGNLLLARALGRQQELQIRLALGASRWRLVTQLVAEGLTLALAGGAAGVAIARLATPLPVTAVPNARAIPGLEQIGVNSRVILFALGASVASALLFSAIGCIGLFRVDRSGFAGERRRTLTPEAKRAASALVAAEIMSVGFAAGIAGAMAFANMLSAVLFEVAPWDPATLTAAVGLLGAATMIASYLPARRADPVSVLSAE